MSSNNWENQTENLKALAESFGAIQQKALRAVANQLKPRLAEVTPVRGLAAGAHGPLPQGALRAAVKGHVSKGDADNPPTAYADFGKLSYIAHMVDVGHAAPGERALARAGVNYRRITHRPTPAHPFVRAVEDAFQPSAQAIYEDSMTEQMQKALEGE